MKIIAFKRAGNHPSLHPLFITEYVDASLIPSTEGYETMLEDHFQLELAKNEERHQSRLKELKELEEATQKAQQAAELIEQKEQKEAEREFNRFKAWLRHQGKK